jgi:hypothetical protein
MLRSKQEIKFKSVQRCRPLSRKLPYLYIRQNSPVNGRGERWLQPVGGSSRPVTRHRCGTVLFYDANYNIWNVFYDSLTIIVTVVYGAGRKSISRALEKAHPFQWPRGPSTGFAPIKIIESKGNIKNKYIGNFTMSFAAAVSVFCTACCEFYVIFRAHPFQWLSLPPPPPSPFVQNNLEINSDMKSA